MIERLVCSLVMLLSMAVLSLALHLTSDERTAQVPAPVCAWPAPRCTSIPPRLEVVALWRLRAERRFGRTP